MHGVRVPIYSYNVLWNVSIRVSVVRVGVTGRVRVTCRVRVRVRVKLPPVSVQARRNKR